MLSFWLQGEYVQEELAELVGELPGVYEKVLSDLPSLVSSISYYKAFVKHSTKRYVKVTIVSGYKF